MGILLDGKRGQPCLCGHWFYGFDLPQQRPTHPGDSGFFADIGAVIGAGGEVAHGHTTLAHTNSAAHVVAAGGAVERG